MAVPKQVLVAERDATRRDQMARALRAAGYATSEARTGRETLRFVQMERPDLVLVGLHLNDIGGRDLARILESNGDHVPIRTIVVSDSRDQAEDRALGGAPEKPVVWWSHVDELVTMVNGVFDLSEDKDPGLFSETVSRGSLRIDPIGNTVEIDGARIELTDKEFRFLHTLALNDERTCTREELKRLVWGEDSDVIGRTVDVLVSRLRSKLTSATGREVISTVRGIGYRFTG